MDSIDRKLRRKVRSANYKDMRPHVFDKILMLLPYFLLGSKSEALINRVCGAMPEINREDR